MLVGLNGQPPAAGHARATERAATRPRDARASGMPPAEEGSDGDTGLVHRFVTEAMLAANVKLKPWITKYCAYFDDTEADVECKGETLEQYNCYKVWCKQLDKELQQFVRKEGFLTAEDCYARISKIIDEDRERHKAAVAAVLAQLQASADFRRIVAGGDGGDGGGDGAGVVCFMFLPVSVEELVTMAMQLGEYTTFSAMMRATAKQVKAEKRQKRAAKAQLRGLEGARGWLLADAEPKGSRGCATPSPSPVSKGADDRPGHFASPSAKAAAADDDDATVEVGAKGDAPQPKRSGVIKVGGAPPTSTLVEDAVAYAKQRVVEVKARPAAKTYDLNDDDESEDDDGLGFDAKQDDGGFSPERNKVFVSRGGR